MALLTLLYFISMEYSISNIYPYFAKPFIKKELFIKINLETRIFILFYLYIAYVYLYYSIYFFQEIKSKAFSYLSILILIDKIYYYSAVIRACSFVSPSFGIYCPYSRLFCASLKIHTYNCVILNIIINLPCVGTYRSVPTFRLACEFRCCVRKVSKYQRWHDFFSIRNYIFVPFVQLQRRLAHVDRSRDKKKGTIRRACDSYARGRVGEPARRFRRTARRTADALRRRDDRRTSPYRKDSRP